MENQYPEHEKLHAVKDKSEICGEFLEWLLSERGLSLATTHEHTDDCCGESGFKECGYRGGDLTLFYVNIENLLAEFFGIDLIKLNSEKDEMLQKIRKSA